MIMKGRLPGFEGGRFDLKAAGYPLILIHKEQLSCFPATGLWATQRLKQSNPGYHAVGIRGQQQHRQWGILINRKSKPLIYEWRNWPAGRGWDLLRVAWPLSGHWHWSLLAVWGGGGVGVCSMEVLCRSPTEWQLVLPILSIATSVGQQKGRQFPETGHS